METNRSVERNKYQRNWLKKAFFVVFLSSMTAFTAVAQMAQQAMGALSDSARRDSASAAAAAAHKSSEMWGYIFGGLGIVAGIAIAWFLAVGAAKSKPKSHHTHHAVKGVKRR